MKLTPAQTAALRAAVDGDVEPFTAAHRAHPRGRPGSRMRSAGATIASLIRHGYLVRVPGKVPQITDAGRTALPGSDPAALKDILELVSTDVPLEVVKSWSWDERAAGEHWGSRLHLKASDNIIRVPPCPPHVEKYRNNAAPRRRVRIGKWVI